MKSIHGQVLDFGSGAGANLKYCLLSGKVVSVMALEPNKNLIPKLTKVMADLAKYHVGTPMPRWEICSNFVQDVPGSEIFDWIILGNVLCEVPDATSALKELDRLLKPGGRIYFCEHVASPRGSFRRRFQNFINPWWSLVSDGCNCNRDSLELIKAVPGWKVCSWAFSAGPPLDIIVGTFQVC